MANYKMTIYEATRYRNALDAAIGLSPLMLLKEGASLEISPEIPAARNSIDEQIKIKWAQRRNCKLIITLPDELLTKKLNTAIRYGYEQIASEYGRKELRILDKAFAMAIANHIVDKSRGS